MKENFLLLRHGGMGDNLFVSAVARVLHHRGYTVDVSTTSKSAPILRHNPHINRIIECERFGPQRALEDGRPANLYLEDGVWFPDLALYKSYRPKHPRAWRPFNVANYYKSIEGCTMHPELSRTQMSNYSNVYDNHLAWAGIDPQLVDDDDKRPVYRVTKLEREWALSVVGGLNRKPILLQTFSSSPAKSFSPIPLIKFLREKNEHVFSWDPLLNELALNSVKVPFPEEIPSIRCTAALIEQCQFCVTADTAAAHLAEALEIPHITFYTIVPAWTISKYYKYEITLDSTAKLDGQPCKCYQITRDCPRRAAEARKNLSKMDSELLAMVPAGHPARKHMPLPAPGLPEEAKGDPITYFKVSTPQGLNQKIDGALKSFDAALQRTAYCLESVNVTAALEEHYDELKEAQE